MIGLKIDEYQAGFRKSYSYTDLRSRVKVNNNVTDFFACNIGTHQGDKTSLTIFDLFIDELSVRLRENCGSGILSQMIFRIFSVCLQMM